MTTRSVKISSKGQITLPKDVREKYHLIEGEEAMILPTKEGVLIRHKRTSLRGILSGKIDTGSFEKTLTKLRKEWTL